MLASIATAAPRDTHWLRAIKLIVRAAIGLPVQSLRRPGRELCVCRLTGKVTAR